MLKKRDLTDFYSSLAATVEVFGIINKKNNELERLIVVDGTTKDSDIAENPLLDVEQQYILTKIRDSQLRAFAEYLMVCMHTFKFKNTSSVPRNINLVNELDGVISITKSDYALLAKITLFNHTINCALCAIDVCKEQPQAIQDIVIVIALLHDFGKCPAIASQFDDKNEDHEKISARFAENALTGFDISDELSHIIFSTLFDYHTSSKEKEKTIYAPLVIKADVTSRLLEKHFLKSKK